MENNFFIYSDSNNNIQVQAKFKDETFWLTQQQIAELFQTTRENIVMHIKNIYLEKELEQNSTCKDFLQVQKEGSREVKRQRRHYNLDMILSVGYRVKSKTATQFRIWSNNVLKEYLKKGFAMNDERLKDLGGGGYFKELISRIRDIRSSEKVFYRQILDLFATSKDYNKDTREAKLFFANVQNKMHYAIHNHTAAELIHKRVDSEKDFMGLTTFKGELPTLTEAKIAKNYLSEKELESLNQLVSGYLDFAERQAQREIVMTMQDWVSHVDNILHATGENVLQGNGIISREDADKKVDAEYKKYQQKTLTQVEKDYLEEIKKLEKLEIK